MENLDPPLALLLIAVSGVASGALNVLAGGGSLIVMPILVALGFSGPEANGTARMGILSQNGAAIARFTRGGQRPDVATAWLAAAALPGAALGAFFGVRLDGPAFRYVLAGVMVVAWLAMARSWRKPKRSKPSKETGADEAAEASNPGPSSTAGEQGRQQARPSWTGLLGMVGVGFYGGFLQAGVGFLIMAVVGRALSIGLVRVNFQKVWIVAIYTLVALPMFAFRGVVDLRAGLVLAVGTTIGGYLGAKLTLDKGEALVRWVLSLALLALLVKLLWG